MPNGDYFIICIYGLSPTFCASFRPIVHFLSSAEASKDDVLRTPACVYGLTLEVDVIAFTHRYVRYSLPSPFPALATRYISYSLH